MADDDLDELAAEADIRSVSVVWAGDEIAPDVTYSGCTVYEAAGYLRAAAIRLERRGAMRLSVVFTDEDDEDEDDEDDE